MTFWTETAIAKHLDGRFYQLQQMSLGKFRVIDLNEPEDEEPEPAPVALAPAPEPLKPVIKPDGSFWLGDIARVVCEVFGVTRLELASVRRNHNLVDARQVFCWLAKTYTSHSYPLIGSWCGRDHTTVMYAVGKIDRRMGEYRSKIDECLSRLGVSQQQEAA